MSMARRASSVARKAGGFGRLVLAVTLLAVLWVSTVRGVERASRGADERRASDRSAIAAGFAGSVRDWLDGGQTEAASLAHAIAVTPVPGMRSTIDNYLAEPRGFSRAAL